jgi:hypothetical protein
VTQEIFGATSRRNAARSSSWEPRGSDTWPEAGDREACMLSKCLLRAGGGDTHQNWRGGTSTDRAFFIQVNWGIPGTPVSGKPTFERTYRAPRVSGA